MKIAIISCFDAYAHRLYFVERFFRKNGHEVQVLVSDFDHMKKEKRTSFQEDRNIRVIAVPAYRRNLSIARIGSHFSFARGVNRVLKQSDTFDLVYAMIPPNFLCPYLGRYRRKHRDTRLVFDLYDLWPESMMRGKDNLWFKFPFWLWGNLRDRHLKEADYILTECNLYQQRLGGKLKPEKTETLYITKRKTGIPLENDWPEDAVSLCYIGSINHIIDIEKIGELIHAISEKRRIVLHVIGDGENRKLFLETVKKAGAEVCYHGVVYDEEQKRKIYSQCQFGLNIMKPSVCVGLSQKSIDYFEAGLPVINSLPYDSEVLVRDWECGLNLHTAGAEETGKRIVSMQDADFIRMRANTNRMFTEVFSEEKIDCILEEMCHKMGLEP